MNTTAETREENKIDTPTWRELNPEAWQDAQDELADSLVSLYDN